MDASGNAVASYASDTWGALTSASETIPSASGWTNPYRYDGRDGVRSDRATGLYWMSVRAYDPTLGRFLSRDPLGRAPLFLAGAPYTYAGNTPLSNVDPSGQRVAGASAAQTRRAATRQARTRVQSRKGKPASSGAGTCGGCKSVTKPGASAQAPIDWQTVVNGALLYVAGAVGFVAGIAALAQIMSNPAAFFAATGVVTLFGGTPATAYLAIFALITVGLSAMVHGIAQVVTGMGWMNGVTASLFTLVEMFVDAIAVTVAGLALISTAAGLLTGIVGIVQTVMEFITVLSEFGLVIQTWENGSQIVACNAQPAKSCPN